MCKQSVVLETLKKQPAHSGLSNAQIALAEAQAEDYSQMNTRIENVEKDVGEIKKELACVKSLAERILKRLNDGNIEKKAWAFDGIIKILKSKKLWMAVLVALAFIAGVEKEAILKIIGL
jgi:ribonucleotide reductase alpha subunit